MVLVGFADVERAVVVVVVVVVDVDVDVEAEVDDANAASSWLSSDSSELALSSSTRLFPTLAAPA